MPFHAGCRHIQQFDGLKEIIAEMMIKSFFDNADFFSGFIGKRINQVFASQIFPVTNYVINDKIGYIGKKIQQAQW
jgi:hypothetical protein